MPTAARARRARAAFAAPPACTRSVGRASSVSGVRRGGEGWVDRLSPEHANQASDLLYEMVGDRTSSARWRELVGDGGRSHILHEGASRPEELLRDGLFEDGLVEWNAAFEERAQRRLVQTARLPSRCNQAQ